MLEYFVHLDSDKAPADLVLVTADIPDDLPKERIVAGKRPSLWRRSPAPPELARIGDEFVEKAGRCILIVPSAVAPHENNWLLNPQHSDFRRVVASGLEPLNYDPRMFAARQHGAGRELTLAYFPFFVRGHRATTVVEIPPRGRKSPFTSAHTGFAQRTTSSSTRFTTFS
jgi:hypothetical protein